MCISRRLPHKIFYDVSLSEEKGDVIGHIWAGGIFNFWKGGCG